MKKMEEEKKGISPLQGALEKTQEVAQGALEKTQEVAQGALEKTQEVAQDAIEKTGEMLKKEYGKKRTQEALRILMVLAASFIMAMNLKSFVRMGGLIPGGFNGLTRLIQQVFIRFLGFEPPFSLINFALNVVPIIIGFKFIGKRFTAYSCLMIVVSGLLTDLLPAYVLTTDVLLVAVFGGLINGLSISICLFAGASSGGVDFISIFLSERFGIDAWNYILAGNIVVLGFAGYLFGWDKALYSIIFQFASTQVLNTLYKRYQKQTLLIITDKPDEVYEKIREMTNHDATLIKGVGCYQNRECNILYSVIGRDQVRKILNLVRKIDPKAFTNVIRTESLSGLFYKKPND